MNERITAKSELLRVLPSATDPAWMATHEAAEKIGPRYSENALATRLPELAKAGKVVGRTRAGKPYREWARAIPSESSAQA